MSSQPTYEELKRESLGCNDSADNKFSAYLWGIETQTRQAILPRRDYVLSLPMRNWNPEYAQDGGNMLRFSAYLWGIETSNRNAASCRPGSYQPTYEELKRIKGMMF